MITSTINRVKSNLLHILYILCLIEIILFPDFKNIYGCIVFVLNFIITNRFVLTYRNIRTNYISVFIIFSYTFCFSFMPLVATLINNVPLTYQFVVPFQLFNHHFLFQCSLIVSFLIAKKIGNHKNVFRNILLYYTSYFRPVSPFNTIILGFIGLLSLVFFTLIDVGILSKISNGIDFLVSAPLVLLSVVYKDKKYNNYVLIFIVFTFIIGIASNSRTTMLFLILILFLICFTKKTIDNERFNISAKKTSIIFFITLIVIGPLADIASAMVLIRHQRTEISVKELFENTISLVQDKETLHKMQKAYEDNKILYLNKNSDGWSEEYTGNIFLDRFCNLRVCDATLYYANKVGYNNPYMRKKISDNIISILPTPILNLLGIDPSIKESLKYSSGDLLYSLATKNNNSLGGFKVSGYTGLGLSTFGFMFYPIAIIIFIITFGLLDGLILPLKNTTIVPLCTMTLLYTFFYLLNNGDGLSGVLNFILRGVIQSIVIYLLLSNLLNIIYGKNFKK